MTDIKIKYRTWGAEKVPPLKKMTLEVPGWAGEKTHDSGQPHHCKPFIDGSTYGYELIYPFDTEVHVRCDGDGDSQFLSKDTNEWKGIPSGMPMANFAPYHFGFTSSLDIETEPGWGTMILPHPRYYTDRTDTVPLPVAGLIASDIWPKIFFIAFKAPLKGKDAIFRKGEGIAHLIFVPKDVKYTCTKMTKEEEAKRAKAEKSLRDYGDKIYTKQWFDKNRNGFDNKYKVLCQMEKTKNATEIIDYMCNIVDEKGKEEKNKLEAFRNNFKCRLIKPKGKHVD